MFLNKFNLVTVCNSLWSQQNNALRTRLCFFNIIHVIVHYFHIRARSVVCYSLLIRFSSWPFFSDLFNNKTLIVLFVCYSDILYAFPSRISSIKLGESVLRFMLLASSCGQILDTNVSIYVHKRQMKKRAKKKN